MENLRKIEIYEKTYRRHRFAGWVRFSGLGDFDGFSSSAVRCLLHAKVFNFAHFAVFWCSKMLYTIETFFSKGLCRRLFVGIRSGKGVFGKTVKKLVFGSPIAILCRTIQWLSELED